MWFRNLQIYRLATGWAMSPGTLEVELAKHPLMPCTGMSLLTRGWVPPVGDAGLVASLEKHLLVALGVEQKILPASVVKEEVKLRAIDLEAKQGYKPGKKQLRDLAEAVTAELLPRALSKRRTTRAWIDPVGRWVVVDASSAARAEELLEHLRNTLGELPVTRLETELSPGGAMTQWLTIGDAPGQFALDSECELKGTGDEASSVRYLRHDLSVKEIREHISGGKLATRVGLLWKDRLSLMLHESFQLKRVKSLAMESGKDEGAGLSAADQFEADFALMTGEFSAVISDLAVALGGLKDEPIPAPAAKPEKPTPEADTSQEAPPPFIQGIDGDEDPIYPQALELVRAEQQASVSFVQRKLRIGYNRAARLVERMEVDGVVGPQGPGGARNILAAKSEASA